MYCGAKTWSWISGPQLNEYTGDIEQQGRWSEEDACDFKDIDLHRYQCTTCSKVFYYSNAAKEYHETGKTDAPWLFEDKK